jgi:hypothetical protein
MLNMGDLVKRVSYLYLFKTGFEDLSRADFFENLFSDVLTHLHSIKKVPESVLNLDFSVSEEGIYVDDIRSCENQL